MSRRRGPMDNVEYAAFVRRVVRRLGVRVGGTYEGADLADLARLSQTVDDALRVAVRGMRDQGYPWQVVADELGVTRQAARQRFGLPGESVPTAVCHARATRRPSALVTR